jgi:hypothetical protein
MNSTLKRLATLAALGTMGVLAPVASAGAAAIPGLPAGFSLPSLPAGGLPQLPAGGLPQLPAGGLPALGAGGLPGLGAGLGDFTPAPLAFTGPVVGQVAAVIGPTVITSAPSTFNNTNIQVSAGSNGSGGQAGP